MARGGRPPVKVYWDGADTALRDELAAGRIEWVDTPADADVVVGPPPERATGDSGDLTDREAEVLGYLADGWSTDEIADRLGIAARTVRYHLDGLYRKLGVGRRTEAVREAVTRGYLRL